jgi:hypothetical protein
VDLDGWLAGRFAVPGAEGERGREQVEMGIREGLAYFEWSAPEDADPRGFGVAECMPALGFTITEAAIRDDGAELSTSLPGRRVGCSLAGLRTWGINDFRRRT